MFRGMIKLALVIFFFAVNINSQTLTNYGFKLGAVASNPIWNHSSKQTAIKTGMDLGFFLNWNLTTNISLLTEVHYVQKGLRFYVPIFENVQNNNGVSVYVQSVDPNVNYLSFPVLIKYDLLKSEVIPYLIGGMRVDFVLSTNEINNPRWLYNNVNNIDFGGSIGFGFQTKSLLGIGTGLEIKYSPSFIKVASSPMAEITNRSYEISFILYE